jgi:hypothetical protein
MAWTDFLDRLCYELFSNYPLAVSAVNRGGTVRSMVLMLRYACDTEFFVLSHNRAEGRSSYSLRLWPSEEGADVNAEMPDIAVQVLTCGVPIPRHGSLFGWLAGDRVTALVAFYAKSTPASLEPYWKVLPFAGIPEAQWPPFTDELDLGQWFWKHHRAGKVSSLGSLIAVNPETVFWADTKAVLGSDCCAVARDVRSPEGYVLQRGRYVHYEALRAGKPVPSLRSLLTGAGPIDLASRFQQYGPSDNLP